MKHRNCHLLVGYWNRLRKGREVPDQTEIDPRAIKRLLSSIFILDATDPFRPVYRLAGTALCDRYGAELKGTSYLARWEDQSRNGLTLLLQQCVAARQPICISSVAASAEYGMVELETVLAPIRFGGAVPSRFIGMTQLIGSEIALGGRPIAFERLVSSEFIHEGGPDSSSIDQEPRPPNFRSMQQRAPHLQLVVSRDKPATLHFETEEMMRIIEALEIVPPPRTNFLR